MSCGSKIRALLRADSAFQETFQPLRRVAFKLGPLMPTSARVWQVGGQTDTLIKPVRRPRCRMTPQSWSGAWRRIPKTLSTWTSVVGLGRSMSALMVQRLPVERKRGSLERPSFSRLSGHEPAPTSSFERINQRRAPRYESTHRPWRELHPQERVSRCSQNLEVRDSSSSSPARLKCLVPPSTDFPSKFPSSGGVAPVRVTSIAADAAFLRACRRSAKVGCSVAGLATADGLALSLTGVLTPVEVLDTSIPVRALTSEGDDMYGSVIAIGEVPAYGKHWPGVTDIPVCCCCE